MVATATYYAPEEAAGRIIPCVAPLCMDGVGEVRAASLQCLECFVQVLRQHDRKLAEDQAAAAQAAGVAQDSTMGGAAPTMGANSMLSWAYSSLMSSVAAKPAAGPQAGPPPPAAAGPAPAAPAAPAAAAAGPAAPAAAGRPAPQTSTSSKGRALLVLGTLLWSLTHIWAACDM
jgi:hypothetical protein